MDDELDLRHFSGVTRLFPLPQVVQFPHSVVPLHIFEPRYRQMTEDAVGDDNLVTVVQLRARGSGGLGSPPVEEFGCLGRILQHERLPDGRYNFLLLGRKRVRLIREVPTAKLYRSAEVEVIEDLYEPTDDPQGEHRARLTTLFRRAFERHQPVDSDLSALLEKGLPLGVLTDIIAHALGLPPEVKQRLLAEPKVERRVETILVVLTRLTEHDPEGDDAPRSFPPPFSMN